MIDHENRENHREPDATHAPEQALDPDLDLILDYLSFRLEPDQMEAVGRRLVTDGAFSEKMNPFLLMMSVPRPWLTEAVDPELAAEMANIPSPEWNLVLTAEEEEYAMGLIREREARLRSTSPESPPSLVRVPLEESTAGPRRSTRRSQVKQFWSPPQDWRLPPWATLRYLGQLAAALLIMGAGIGGMAFGFDHRGDIEDAGAAWQLALRGVANTSHDRWFMTLPGNSQVMLEPGSHAWTEPALGSTESVVRIRGTGTLIVTDATRAVLVVAPAGDALLGPGRYRISVDSTGQQVMQVNVERGLAQVRGREVPGGEEVGITVNPGQHVRVMK